MKTHWTHYWHEMRGRYRFIYAQIQCTGQLHFIGDGLRTTAKKREVDCRNCRKLKRFPGKARLRRKGRD